MSKIFQVFIKTVLISLAFLFLILIFNRLSIGTASIRNSSGYPLPITQPTLLMTGYSTDYPVPPTVTAIATNERLISTQVHPTLSSYEAAIATNIANKRAYTPSATEIAAMATQMYGMKQMQNLANLSTPAYFTMAINSSDDFPKFVYNAPFFASDNPNFSTCLKFKKPGTTLRIRSLNELPDYYILPFYNDIQICGIALIDVKDGIAAAAGWSRIKEGGKFPSLEAEEAAKQVILRTGKKVTENPILVAHGFLETNDLFNPKWQVKTEDGETYIVINYSGPTDEGTFISVIEVLNMKELHKIQ